MVIAANPPVIIIHLVQDSLMKFSFMFLLHNALDSIPFILILTNIMWSNHNIL